MPDSTSERQPGWSLDDYLRLLRERLWIIVLCVAVLVGGALYVSLQAVPQYVTSASLVPVSGSMDSAIMGSGTSDFYYYGPEQQVEMDLAVLTLNPAIAEAVKAELGSDADADTLAGMVTAAFTPENQVITLNGRGTDPTEVAAVVNAFAEQFIVFQRDADRAVIASARDLLQQRMDGLSAVEKTSEYGLMMQEKYESLLILESIQDGGYSVVRQAAIPGAPLPSGTSRNLLLAAGIGLVLGIALVLLLVMLDKRIKDEKTLERVSGLPVLASVPVIGGSWKRVRRGSRRADAIGFERSGYASLESFRTLRSSLQYFDVDSALRTIMITSALPQEGKTTTTINLGLSLALSGKRVIILEADLRRPMVNEYLGLEDEVGLSTVLAGKTSALQSLQLLATDPYFPAKARKGADASDSALLRRNLYCLPSGPLPPNPAELLASARMGEVIAELQEAVDYVLIDTPPLLPVSDALSVARHVDGVILTARLYATTLDEVRQARDLLDRAGARVIGVVADGVRRRDGYYVRRGYGYTYAPQE